MSSTYDLSDQSEDYSSDISEGAASPQHSGFDSEETDGENSDQSEGEYESEGVEDTTKVQQLDASRSGQESESAESMEDGSERLREQGEMVGIRQSELLFRDATPSEDELVEEGESRGMIDVAGGESEERSSERSLSSQVSRPDNALPSNSKKRPHHLISRNTSESENPFGSIAAGLQAASDFIEDLHGLSPEDQKAFAKFFANYDDTLTLERFKQIGERRQQTEAYLADEANYERLLQQEGGFLKLVQENVSRAGTEYSKGQLHSIFTPERPFCIVTRQYPGTPTSHLAFLVRIINLAAGGFFFFTSACGRKAFWTTFFPLIMPFFRAGGRALLAIPVGELSVEALEEERSWQQVIEKQTSGQLRFVFVTDYDQYQSWHIKEGLVVAPGGEMVDVQMSGNFNSRGVGTEKAMASDAASATLKPGSAERMTAIRLHLEEPAGRLHVQDLADCWFDLARDRSLFYNVPSLFDFLAQRHSKDLEALRRSKKAALTRDLLAELEREDSSEANRRLQEAIALAAPISQLGDVDAEKQFNPLTLPMELSDDARREVRSLVVEKKKVLSEFMGQFKREWTKEEKAAIAAMNKEITAELVDVGGDKVAEALQSIEKRRQAIKSERTPSKASSTSIRPNSIRSVKRSKLDQEQQVNDINAENEDADRENTDSRHSVAGSSRVGGHGRGGGRQSKKAVRIEENRGSTGREVFPANITYYNKNKVLSRVLFIDGRHSRTINGVRGNSIDCMRLPLDDGHLDDAMKTGRLPAFSPPEPGKVHPPPISGTICVEPPHYFNQGDRTYVDITTLIRAERKRSEKNTATNKIKNKIQELNDHDRNAQSGGGENTS